MQKNSRVDLPKIDKNLAAELESVMAADRKFFIENPDRDYFIRSITPAELSEAKAMGKVANSDSQILVGEIASGCRIRSCFSGNDAASVAEFMVIKKQLQQQLGADPSEKFSSSKVQKARPKPEGFGRKKIDRSTL